MEHGGNYGMPTLSPIGQQGLKLIPPEKKSWQSKSSVLNWETGVIEKKLESKKEKWRKAAKSQRKKEGLADGRLPKKGRNRVKVEITTTRKYRVDQKVNL